MAFFTQELKNATILKREMNERASRYTHFELKNITIDENKFTLLAQNCIAAITVYFYHLVEILEKALHRSCGAYFTTFHLHVQRLIEGGTYSSKYRSYAIWQLTD